jgi:hypothetical protein
MQISIPHRVDSGGHVLIFLGGNQTDLLETSNPTMFGYLGTDGDQRVLVQANFTEREQLIPSNLLRLYGLGY